MIKPFYIFTLLISFISCTNSSHENTKTVVTNHELNNDSNKLEKDSLSKTIASNPSKNDTILKDTTNTEKIVSVSNWKTTDFIIKKKDKTSKPLQNYIEYEREQWKNMKSPFIAKYMGCDFGDYFHLTFEDKNGKTYDFGFANNNLDGYELYDILGYVDNPKYINKTFNIYWNWKPASFPCCDGEYKIAEAYLPSISKLELIETKTHK